MSFTKRCTQWVIAAGTVALAIGNGCSSSSSSDTASDGGTSSGGDGAAQDGGGAGACAAFNVSSCGAAPALHPAAAGSVYCGYDADGGSLTCSSGEECCLGGAVSSGTYAANECVPAGTQCTNGGTTTGESPGLPIACEQTADCASGAKCCLQGVIPESGCAWPVYRDGEGAACEASGGCATGEAQVCSSDAECPSGTTCIAGKWKTFQLGFCLAALPCPAPPPDSGTTTPDASAPDTSAPDSSAPACYPDGQYCSTNADCCKSDCDSATGKCGCSTAEIPSNGYGEDCTDSSQCCTGFCFIDQGQSRGDCCVGGAGLGESCMDGTDCCSHVCDSVYKTCL